MHAKSAIINDFTRGPLFGNLLRFSIPFMITNALQVVYAVVDMIVVGHCVGSAGLAAVSIASQAFAMMGLACSGLAGGGQIYISQLIGGGRRDRLNRTLGSFFSLILLIGVVVSAATLVFSRPLLSMLNTPEASFRDANIYMVVNSIGQPFTFGYLMFASAMRGLGDSRHPLAFILLSSVLNLVLDIWFVAALGLGVFGAALATVIAQAVKFFASWVFLYSRRADFGFDFRRKSWRIDGKIAVGILKLGIPLAIRFGAIHASMLFVHSLVNSLGYQAAAVFGIGLRLDSTVANISAGILTGASGIIGQNYGAHKIERIRATVRYAWMVSAAMYALYTLLLVTCTREMFGCFTSDREVLDLAPVFVGAIVWQFPALVLNRGTTALIHGIGNIWLSFIFAMFDAFVMRIILSWFFGDVMGYGLFGYILGYGLAAYGLSVPGLFYYLFWPWQKRRLVTD